MKELKVTISNRRIMNLKEVQQFFRDMKDGQHLLTVKDYRKRSGQQNAYYWAVVVPLVRRGLYDAGFDDVTDDDTAHEVIKKLFLSKEIVSRVHGEIIEISGSSTKLSIPEFAEFLDRVAKWAAEYLQVYIPAPNEAMANLSDYADRLENEND